MKIWEKAVARMLLMDYIIKLLELDEAGSWVKEVIIQDLRTLSSEK